MAKSRSPSFFLPKDDNIRRIMENLTHYPVFKTNPQVTRQLGRYKWTRRQKQQNNIFIKDGIISLPQTVKIQKKGNGFEIIIR